MARAAVGFRSHSGWACIVAITGPTDQPVVLVRRRIEMVDRTVAGQAQPYHAAVGLDLAQAENLIATCARQAVGQAQRELAALLKDIRSGGHDPAACALLLAAGRPLPALPAILASHALIHTAEGDLFRDALRAAASACTLPVFEIKERDLLSSVPPAIQHHFAQMSRIIGPPWRQDEKFASMAAWLALAAS